MVRVRGSGGEEKDCCECDHFHDVMSQVCVNRRQGNLVNSATLYCMLNRSDRYDDSH